MYQRLYYDLFLGRPYLTYFTTYNLRIGRPLGRKTWTDSFLRYELLSYLPRGTQITLSHCAQLFLSAKKFFCWRLRRLRRKVLFCLRTSLHSHYLTTLPETRFLGDNDSNDSWHPTGLAHKSLLPTRLRRLITGVTSCPNRAVCLNLFEITSASMLPISSANNVMSCPLVWYQCINLVILQKFSYMWL